MFKPIRYGQTPEPATPYQRAAVWEDRIGSARVQAKNWRLAFFGALALSGGLAGGLVWQSARVHIVPWVVQVDRIGEAQAVAVAEGGYLHHQVGRHDSRLDDVNRDSAPSEIAGDNLRIADDRRFRSRIVSTALERDAGSGE